MCQSPLQSLTACIRMAESKMETNERASEGCCAPTSSSKRTLLRYRPHFDDFDDHIHILLPCALLGHGLFDFVCILLSRVLRFGSGMFPSSSVMPQVNFHVHVHLDSCLKYPFFQVGPITLRTPEAISERGRQGARQPSTRAFPLQNPQPLCFIWQQARIY